MAALLAASGAGASKSRIMADANLSFSLLEKYLAVAIRSGFVEFENGKFRLTEHGHDFLKAHKRLCERYYQTSRALESLSIERERLGLLCLGVPSGRRQADFFGE